MNGAVRLLRYTGALCTGALAVSGLLAVLATVVFFSSVGHLPRVPEPLRRIIETPPTEIFAANGERVFQIGGRTYVSLNQVSPHLVQAILAVEDHRFWDHKGINKLRILKALWITLFSPGRVQGASTITQQLAKNLFFSFERTYTRKFKELLVALQIETQFSKQEILEAYLNQIYFGPGAQGVGAAAQRFFGKGPGQLNLAESSLLAGLPKSPTRYNPLRHFEQAKARQRVVLHRMQVAGTITAEEATAARSDPIAFQNRSGRGDSGGYFVDLVLNTLEGAMVPRWFTRRIEGDHHHRSATSADRRREPPERPLRPGCSDGDQSGHPRGRGCRGAASGCPGGGSGQFRGHQSSGGRSQLCRNRIQSRHCQQPSSRIGVQTFSLLHRLRFAGTDTGLGGDRSAGQHTGGRGARLEAEKFRSRICRSRDPEKGLHPFYQHRGGPARGPGGSRCGDRYGETLWHPKSPLPGLFRRSGNIRGQSSGDGLGLRHLRLRRDALPSICDLAGGGCPGSGIGRAHRQRSAGVEDPSGLPGGRHDAGGHR
jgi:hypothetical protein